MKTRNVRAGILNTAAKLFYTQGYNATGINQIIEESSIARASLYNHFKSKSDLLIAYLEELDLTWFKGLDSFLADKNDPKEKLLGIFDYRIERQVFGRFGGCSFVKICAEIDLDNKEVFTIVDRNKMRLKAFILTLVKQAPAENRSLSNEDLADTLYLLMEGATVTANFQKSEFMIIKAKAIAEKLL